MNNRLTQIDSLQQKRGEDRVRHQRNRFVAFAFCSADVLIEIDHSDRITYITGQTERFFGEPPEGLEGRMLGTLTFLQDAAMLTELLRRLRISSRLDRVNVRFQGSQEKPVSAVLSGLIFPQNPNTLFLTINRALDALDDGAEGEAIVQGIDDFAALAQRRMRQAEQLGENYELTLIELGAIQKGPPMEPEKRKRFEEGAQASMRAWSVDGASVGKLHDNKFGVIHERRVKPATIQKSLADMATVFDSTMQVSASSLNLVEGRLSKEDINKALVYTLNRFMTTGGADFATSSLSDGYQQAVDETVARVTAFRNTMSANNFTLLFQPIVNLKSWTVHHYECLTRIKHGGMLQDPSRFIGFAEEFGVINEFDEMILEKVIVTLNEKTLINKKDVLTVNVSGRSITNPLFVQQLLLTLVNNKPHLPHLMFELTETAEVKNLEECNKILQKIRSFGCQVAIDDFGAGAAALQYLKAFQVDFVKIDGSYIRDAYNTSYGRPFLRAMAALVNDMKMKAIGEMVEDNRSMWLLHDFGIDYGQGHLFSPPMENVSGFKLLARPTRERDITAERATHKPFFPAP